MRARPAPAVARLVSLLLLVAGAQALAPPRADAAAEVSLSTSALTFGPATPGPTSETKNVTVTNTGTESVVVGSPAISGADKAYFWANQTCGGGVSGTKTLAPGQACAIGVTFTAPVVGARTGTLSIPNTAGDALTVALSATTLMPDIDITAPSAFAATAVGDTSVKVVTVSSTGDLPLEVGHATVSGANANQFAVISDDCTLASPVPDGDTCTVTVRFRPTSAGTKSATLSVPSNAGAAATVPLSGPTGDPFLSPSPGGFVFPGTPVGGYLSGTVTVSNTGPGAIDYTSAALSGTHANQYAVDDSCLLSDRIAATPCAVKVFFRPTSSGSKTATLTLSAVGQPDRTISLAGLGAAVVRSLEATPSSLGFGSVPTQTTSGSQLLTITNTGNVPQFVSQETFGIAPSTDFTVDYSCPVALAPGDECSARVLFRPTVTGARSANLTVIGLGTTTVVPLNGTGTAAAPNFTLSPASGLRQFGSIAVGATTGTFSQTITNNTGAPITISSPTVTGPSASQFQITGTTCTPGTPMLTSSACTIGVRFAPTSMGLKAGTLTIPSSVAGPPVTFALTGIATQGYPFPGPIAPIDYGSSPVGVSTAGQTITVVNNGNGSMDMSAPTITGSDAGHFTITGSTCTGATVAKNGSCNASVAFSPSTRGAKSATLRFTTAAGIQSTVSLLGTGRAAVANVDTGALAFGSEPVGDPSAPLTATVTNTGDASLSLDAPTLTGTGASQFQVTENECAGTVVAPGDDCRITLAFDPTTRGAKTATLNLPNDAGAALTVSLSGTGTEAISSVNPTSRSFGSQAVGTPTATFPFTVTNTGQDPLRLTDVAFAGADPGAFDLTGSTCHGATLAFNATCTVSVRFNPSSAGSKSATFRLGHNGATAPTVITLSGTGLAPVATPSSSAVDFGEVDQGDDSEPRTLSLANTGTAPLLVDGFDVLGADAASFSVGDDDCTGASVAPGNACTFSVTFAAGDSGTANATLEIVHNAESSPTLIPMTGVSLATSDLKVLGIGSLYTGHDRTVTRTVKTSGTLMKYKLGVVNESGAPQTYKIRLTRSGAVGARTVWSTGVGAKELTIDGVGNFITPVVQPGKTGTFELRVTPTAPGQVTTVVDVDLLTPDGFHVEGISTETNTAAPLNGTSGFELFAGQGSQPLVGGPVNGQTATSPALNVGQSTSFKVRLKNNSTTARQIGLRLTPTPGCAGSFTVTVKAGTAVITTAALAGTYLTPSLGATKYKDITVSIKRTAVGCGAMRIRADSLDSGATVRTSYLITNASYNAVTD
ncbi:choice-of-anchor D domain-containing protein [Nocardioides stalactiti]|uniref:choice-of-anchor D domain-containing protein n=1 Tax=Nocardioides stalactiti TaxID=2755356 RepID=UPI0015FF40D2|nr:choice-of-anchor D domain-containing protein [Nocardioides stalactiti]